jgi:hypothetical protein
MKNIVKVVVFSLALLPVAFLSGCGKKCGSQPETHKLEKMKHQYGGK